MNDRYFRAAVESGTATETIAVIRKDGSFTIHDLLHLIYRDPFREATSQSCNKYHAIVTK